MSKEHLIKFAIVIAAIVFVQMFFSAATASTIVATASTADQVNKGMTTAA